MSKCHLLEYVVDKGEFSEKLDDDLCEHIKKCPDCEKSYIEKIKENNKLKMLFRDLYLGDNRQ